MVMQLANDVAKPMGANCEFLKTAKKKKKKKLFEKILKLSIFPHNSQIASLCSREIIVCPGHNTHI
jgi:hypothetical protein